MRARGQTVRAETMTEYGAIAMGGSPRGDANNWGTAVSRWARTHAMSGAGGNLRRRSSGKLPNRPLTPPTLSRAAAP